MTIFLIVFFILAVLIGFLGRKKTMSFWGYFFASLIFGPFVGALLLLVTEKKQIPSDTDEKKDNETK